VNVSMRSPVGRLVVVLALILMPATISFAQATAPDPDVASLTPSLPEFALPKKEKEACKGNFFKNILCDQRAIWTSPARLGGSDARWLVPLGLATGGLIATDRRTAGSLDNSRTRLAISRDISYAGSTYSLGTIVTATYLIGRGTSNPRLRQTGKLAAEALIDATIVDLAFKEITQRPRPLEDGGRGRFFTGGNSHPSGHSAAAFSVATVFACQYNDQPLIHYGAYAAAGAVGISRFTGRRHFLSDVLVGSALGYGVGRYVCHMGKVRNSENGAVTEYRHTRLLPSNFSGRFDRGTREYGLALAWKF
jgi:membrane-associated phospholipid phosphatase